MSKGVKRWPGDRSADPCAAAASQLGCCRPALRDQPLPARVRVGLSYRAQGAVWSAHWVYSPLDWSWTLWQKASGRAKAGHLLRRHRRLLLGAFFLQAVISVSNIRRSCLPAGLPACQLRDGREGGRVIKIARMFIPTLVRAGLGLRQRIWEVWDLVDASWILSCWVISLQPCLVL